jgi:hypothetical protein
MSSTVRTDGVDGGGGQTSAFRTAAVGIDRLVLLTFGLGLAAACFGHFIKPHGDFYEFRETGQALLSGRLPESFKRGPVFPLLVALTGRCIEAVATTARPADQVAAEAINAVLLPVNVVLLYEIGRRWLGRAARWPAMCFLLLPLGLYSTAHTLVEPLLIMLTLSALLAAGPDPTGRRPWLAYALAGAAAMARYEAAGLLLGLVLADCAGRRPWRQTLRDALLAGLPLVLWLTLTAFTWQTRGAEHYVAQVLERPGFDPGWPLSAVRRCLWPVDRLSLPVWLADWEQRLRTVPGTLLLPAALLGAGLLIARGERAAIAGTTWLAVWWLVFSCFPFREQRFGYPPAPFVLLLIAVVVQELAQRIRAAMPGSLGRAALVTPVVLLSLALLPGELTGLRRTLLVRPEWNVAAVLVCLMGVVLVAATSLTWAPASWLRSLAAVPVLLAFAAVQVRAALPLLGSGREMVGMVEAARWVRKHVPAGQGVVSNTPGLLRLYAGHGATDRFIGFDQIAAEDWPGVVAECRRRGIGYIVWHDRLFEEHGGYYAGRWRLTRFEVLSTPDGATGAEVVWESRPRPDGPLVRIVRITRSEREARPSDASSSGDGPTDTAPGAGGSPAQERGRRPG